MRSQPLVLIVKRYEQFSFYFSVFHAPSFSFLSIVDDIDIFKINAILVLLIKQVRGALGKAKGAQFLVWDVGGQEKLRPLWRSYTR